MTDLVQDWKRRKAKKKRGNFSGFTGENNFDMSVLTTVRHKFTKEENFEAYKLFSIMDVDRSGLVSLRELQRVLCGDTFRTVDADFDHPDVGITWSLDSDNCVCIQQIEPKSPASRNRSLINGLRLYQINDMKIKVHSKKSLEKLQHELIKIHDDPVDLKFFEPLFIITEMTCSLDVQVYGKTYTAWLPVGAVNNVTVMEQNIQSALCKAHSDFSHIDVRINRKTLSVSFFCPDFPFRLQFGTGTYFQSSCRYAIGFSAFDTPVSKRHTGHDTTISLNLGLGDKEMDILMEELFGIFDADGSGEFQYEEFRDFHTKLLANEDCVNILRSYAQWRFADIKMKAKQKEQMDDRRAKMKRRYLLKEKNKEIHDRQHAFRRANSVECEDGVNRRIYKVRKQSSIRVVSPDRLSKKAVGSAKPVKEPSTVHVNREKNKAIMKEQELGRQRKVNELAEMTREQEREMKRLERDVSQKTAKIHMAEVMYVLRKAYNKGFKQMETDVEGMGAMGIMQDKIITPALKVSSNMFTDAAGVDDIELEEMNSTEIHPAAGKYFFMREKENEKFNVKTRHPTFFGADFAREASRHSSFALGVCRAALSQRQAPNSKVIILKHPLTLERIKVIDRALIADKLSQIIAQVESPEIVANEFVESILFHALNPSDRSKEQPISSGVGDDYGDPVSCNEEDSMGSNSQEKACDIHLSEADSSSSLNSFRSHNGDSKNDTKSHIESMDGDSTVFEEKSSASNDSISEKSSSASSLSRKNLESKSESHITGSGGGDDVSHVTQSDDAMSENDDDGSSSRSSSSSSSSSSSTNISQSMPTSHSSHLDSDSQTETTNDQSSASFVPRPRQDVMRQQRANVYNGLNNTLSTQLSGLTDQIRQLAKQKEMEKYVSNSKESLESKRMACAKSCVRKALLEGSLCYLRLCGVVVQRYTLEMKYNENVFEIDTTSLETSIFHNTATVLVQAICNFGVGRVVEATKDMKNFWAYGTDIFNNGEESEENSVELRVKARPKRQGTIHDKIEIAAPTTEVNPLLRRRTGLVMKRMSTAMTSNGNIMEGRNNDDDDDSSLGSSEVVDPHDEPVLLKNFVMGLHSICDCEAICHDNNLLSRLRPLQPRIRAYMTYGKWKVYSFECDSLRSKSLALQPDLSVGGSLSKFSWTNMDIQDRLLWNDIEMKNHQDIHLICTDGSSRVDNVICKCTLTFEDIRECHANFVQDFRDERRLKKSIIDNDAKWDDNDNEPFDMPITWKCTSSFENVEIKGVLKMSINVNGGNWIPPPRSEEYWKNKRMQHWTTYPLVPTSTGIVRQKFREIANEYDKMKIIHPAFWGFSVRWKGTPEDEVRFLHPMYHNFSMVKKPISLQALEEIDINARKKIKVNPYKWKPIHECKVCYAKLPGCPRCWEMPLKRSGERCRPVDFQYDPDLAIKKANEEKVKKAILEQKKKAKLEAKRALRAAGELDYDSDDTIDNSVDTDSKMVDPEDMKENIELHTQLTTEYALQLYRQRAQNLMTVYVKVAPGGYVRRLVVDPEDTIWHLHNMLRSHSDLGSVRGAQFVLPTNDAFIECDADIIPESEYLGSHVTANIKLKDYGLRKVGGTITILYLPRYKETTIIPLMQRFMQDNMDITGMNINLPILKYIHNIPDALEKDEFQLKLCTIMKRQYHDQEVLNLARLKAMGSTHRKEMHQNYATFIQKKQQDKLQQSRERREFEKFVEKKLKGLVGQEREDRRRQLMDIHFSRSGGTNDDKLKIAKAKKDADRAEKLRKKREMIAQGLLSRSDSTSKVQSAIDDAISMGSASTMSKGEEDFKNKMVSFAEETSKSLKDFDDDKAESNEKKIEIPPLPLHNGRDDEGSLISATTFEEDELSATSKALPKLKKVSTKNL